MQAMLSAFVVTAVITVGAYYALSDQAIVDRVTEAVNMDINHDGASDDTVRLD